MDKIIYFENLFSKRREKLLELCHRLHREGKRFLYILPSREAIKDVRYSLIEKNGGIFNSHIIMFDELDEFITDNIYESKLVGDVFCSEILKNISLQKKDELKYFYKIYDKKGFISETLAFIKKLKRNCIDEERLLSIIEKEDNNILKLKLQDMYTLYNGFNEKMKEINLYKIEDLSIKALEQVESKNILDYIDTIIIDGFINYDKVYMEIIKKINEHKKCNIYINASFKNSLNEEFIKKEIINELVEVGFVLKDEKLEEYEINKEIKEISRILYSGEKLKCKTSSVEINKYPSVESEIRETARKIKKKLIQGEEINDMAIFVNNKDLYMQHIINVFKEFNLPCELSYELPLKNSEGVRRILCTVEENQCEMKGIEWVEYLKNRINTQFSEAKDCLRKALYDDLSEQDCILIRSYEAFIRIVKEIKYTFTQSNVIDESLDSKYVLNVLKRFIDSSTITIDRKEDGGVRILNTDLARGTFYSDVYILGVNEGQLPKGNFNNGLFNDYDLSVLNSNEINYGDFLWEIKREKIRFNFTLAAAVNQLILSYRGADEEGKYLIPSSFIEEIKFVSNLHKNHINEFSMRDRFNISFNDVMSSRELKLMTLKNIFEKEYKGFEVSNVEEQIQFLENFEDNIRKTITNGYIEYERDKGQEFNKYDGWIDGDLCGEIKHYSPSRITSYLKCPFGYFIERVLNINTFEDDDENFTALEIGNLYHHVMQKYFESFIDDVKNYVIDFTFYRQRFESIFDEEIKTIEKDNMTEEDRLIILNELRNIILSFIKMELNRLENYYKETSKILMPYMLEKEIKDEDTFGIPIYCFVDRVDMEYEIKEGEFLPTGKFVIYDYKKNSIKDINDILKGKECQLTIYYHLIKKKIEEELNIENAECMALLYFSIEKTLGKDNMKKKTPGIVMDGIYKEEYKKFLGVKKTPKINNDGFFEILEYIKNITIEAVGNISKGRFNYYLNCEDFDPAATCNYDCKLKNVCRYSRTKVEKVVI